MRPQPEQQRIPQKIELLQPVQLRAGEKLRVVATTTIVGDLIQNVAGDQVDLITLMAPGVDPHTYVSTPAHTAAVHDAHVTFVNGAGLEANLSKLLASAGGNTIQIVLTDGLDLLAVEAEPADAHEGSDEEHAPGEVDPHVWFSVPNVIAWARTVEKVLSTLDPDRAARYRANAAQYTEQLEMLDTWIFEQVAQIPQANRRLVTNHPSFGYLAQRYGLEQIGAVYPVSPAAEPSARELAALQRAIRSYGVPAMFTETTVNPKLAERIAQDTGVRLVRLYTGSLGEPGSGVDSYIALMRYDIKAIAEALRSPLVPADKGQLRTQGSQTRLPDQGPLAQG